MFPKSGYILLDHMAYIIDNYSIAYIDIQITYFTFIVNNIMIQYISK